MQVAKPVFSFPLQDYAARGHNIIVRGKLDRIMKGDAWGACIQHAAGLLCKNVRSIWASTPNVSTWFFLLPPAMDSQIMLVHNTLWSRRFFRRAAQLFDSPAELAQVCQTLLIVASTALLFS